MLMRLNHLGLAIAFRVLSGQGTRQAFDPYPQRAQAVVALDSSNSLLVMAPAYGTFLPWTIGRPL